MSTPHSRQVLNLQPSTTLCFVIMPFTIPSTIFSIKFSALSCIHVVIYLCSLLLRQDSLFLAVLVTLLSLTNRARSNQAATTGHSTIFPVNEDAWLDDEALTEGNNGRLLNNIQCYSM